MAGGIDLNAVDEGDEEAPPEEEEEEEEEGGEEEEEEENNNTSNTVSPPPLPSSSPEVCAELWRACAGPLVTPPRKGSVVVYLPQGHLEQAGDVAHLLPNVPPSPPLSSLVFCRVVDVKLHADVGTDDVYAQLFLVAESEDVQKRLSEGVEDEGGDDEEEAASVGKSLQMMTHMFCKTLTASDTSTHGGLSVPRRAAEDCFPPLDYKQQRPSQELTAKDLHGTQWRFRHIYRGQPRRHLLTTGWSAFVNKKKLVLGDAVLFLRGTDGELRLGIRRAGRLKGGLSFSTSGIGMNAGTFADVSRAIESKAAFLVYYNPRGSSAEFIIPYRRFLKSCSHSFSLGTRVKMRFENEDATERYSGLITGFSDIDPIRWSGSKWRCLIAKWDGDYDACGINRVSPWDVEPTGCVSGSDCLPAANCKRAKLGPANNLEFSFPNAGQYPDFRKSGMLHGVLQGQEIVGFRSKHDGGDPPNPQPSELGHHQSYERCNSYVTGCLPAMPVDSNGLAMGKYEFSNKSTGFGESFRFNKVLQGQEIFPSMPFCAGRFSPHPRDDTIYANNWYPPLVGVGNPKQQPPISSTNLSSPSSVFMFPQVGSRPPCSPTLYQSKDCEQVEVHWASHSKLYSELEVPMHCHQALFHGIKCSSTLSERSHIGNRDAICAAHPDSTDAHCSLSTPRKSCRLFGFSLTETDPVTRSDVPESTTLLSRADNIFHSSKGRDSRYCSEAQLH